MEATASVILLKDQFGRQIANVPEDRGRDPFILGRGVNSHAQLVLPDVSRTHAQLTFQDGSWVIEDLGSFNGTWLERGDGLVRLTDPTILENGDRLKVGSFYLEVAIS